MCFGALCVVKRAISNILQDICPSQNSPITYTCTVEESRQEISSIFTRITTKMLHVMSDIELPWSAELDEPVQKHLAVGNLKCI